VAELLRYGAYLPQYRAPLGEIQSFEGRPGRPRAKTLATPSLDEDALTMAWEAANRALGDGAAPAAVISLTHSAPFGYRKMSQTIARSLELGDDITCFDLAGHQGSLLDAFDLAASLSGRGEVLVIVSDHVVSYDDKVCDMLSAGGAAAFVIGATGGFATLGEIVRDGREVYDIWRLGTEPEPRYRLEVLFDAYAAAAKGAFVKLERLTERSTAKYAAVCASQPHPQNLRALGRCGVTEPQLANTSFVGNIGNLGCASVGVALALGLDTAKKGQAVAAFGYGAGEGIAQAIEIIATPPKAGVAAQLEGEAIGLGTYYRWTRGRQQEPH
jgi:hydroxymethylglutaryl-CoA synthase